MFTRIQSAIQGFRRGGVAHSTKPTYYVAGYFSEAQMAQLKDEPRLAISEVETLPEGETAKGGPAPGRVDEHSAPDLVAGVLAGAVDGDGEVVPLEDMTVPKLKEIAKDMEIEGFAAMKKADLVTAIKAKEVPVPDGDAIAEEPAQVEPAAESGEQATAQTTEA